MAAVGILTAPVLLGPVRVGFGTARFRPVGYLVVLLALTVALGLMVLSYGPIRTRVGGLSLGVSTRRYARAVRAPLMKELAFDGFSRLTTRAVTRDGGGGGGCGGGGGGGGGAGGGCGG